MILQLVARACEGDIHRHVVIIGVADHVPTSPTGEWDIAVGSDSGWPVAVG